MYKQFLRFILRWIVNSFAMYLCIRWFASESPEHVGLSLALLSGLIFSLVSSIIKPFATIVSLPITIVTLGFFQLIVNALMVSLAFWLIRDVSITFWGAFISAILISIINIFANVFLIPKEENKNRTATGQPRSNSGQRVRPKASGRDKITIDK